MSTEHPSAEAGGAAERRSPHVLVVNSHSPLRTIIRDVTRGLGYHDVKTCTTGSEALKHLSGQAVDLVIADVHLPELDGLALLERIRSSAQWRGLPVLLMTDDGRREIVDRAIGSRVSGIIVKPFTAHALQDKIRRLLTLDWEALLPASGTAASDSALVQAPQQATILVIDDDPGSIELISGVLGEHYRVRAATSGTKGLAIARGAEPPDLILVDVTMPEMDGFEVCRQLHADPATHAMPVIFLTSRSDVSDIARGLGQGAVDYVAKPADGTVLLARVRTHLRLKRARDDLADKVDALVEVARLREEIERITQHDLKSPLAGILDGCAALLDRGLWLGTEQRTEVERIRQGAFGALDMINRSLDLYRMETGQYQPKAERVDLVPLAERVVYGLRAESRGRDVSIDMELPDQCWVLGEASLCASLLKSLVRNAVEGLEGSGQASISMAQGDAAEVRIRHDRPLSESDRARFFNKYAADTSGGLQLGVYAAQLIARTQGGDVELDPWDHAGTTVVVRLPTAD